MLERRIETPTVSEDLVILWDDFKLYRGSVAP